MLAVRDAGLEEAAGRRRAAPACSSAATRRSRTRRTSSTPLGRAQRGRHRSTSARSASRRQRRSTRSSTSRACRRRRSSTSPDAYGLKGANTYFAGTAEAGAKAIGRALPGGPARRGRHGRRGGFDDAVVLVEHDQVRRARHPTRRNDLGAAHAAPTTRPRRHRDRRGRGVLVLEETEPARRAARGSTPRSRASAAASTPDALITPDPEGARARAGDQARAARGRAAPASVDYVVAHGSGTRLGDASEARALERCSARTATAPAASSVKARDRPPGARAAGALNAARGRAGGRTPGASRPRSNLEHPDPACSTSTG